MKFDKKIYLELKKLDSNNEGTHSEYWKKYIDLIDQELFTNGFKNFGNKYHTNAGGFGDAPKVTPKPLFRKILRIPFLYKKAELFYVKFFLKRLRTTFFPFLEKENLSTKNLLRYIAQKVSNKTKKLKIIRTMEVDDKIIPHSYSKGAIHLHMIEKIISYNKLDISSDGSAPGAPTPSTGAK